MLKKGDINMTSTHFSFATPICNRIAWTGWVRTTINHAIRF